jgi:hypothetical protein
MLGGDSEGCLESAVNTPLWYITPNFYELFRFEVQGFSVILPPGWQMPSRNSLNQNVGKYFECVRHFLPIIHPTTFSVEKRDTELVLAAAAHGSMYRLEHNQAYELYLFSEGNFLRKEAKREPRASVSSLIGPKQSIRDRNMRFMEGSDTDIASILCLIGRQKD